MLKTWDFLPKFLTSLEPYDRFYKRMRDISIYNNHDFVVESIPESKECLLNNSKLYHLNIINENS